MLDARVRRGHTPRFDRRDGPSSSSTKPDGLPPWMVAPDDPDSELTSSIMIVISTIQTCHCMLLWHPYMMSFHLFALYFLTVGPSDSEETNYLSVFSELATISF